MAGFEKKTRISWANHLIELLVVFVGITTAFMLNNWWEDEKDRDREQQYLRSFVDELEGDAVRLDTILAQNERNLSVIETIVGKLLQGEISEDSLMIAVSQMVQISLFIPKTNAYESAKYSDGFTLLRDYELKTKLIGYYERYEGKKLVEEYFRMYIDRYILPYLFNHIDMLSGTLRHRDSIDVVQVKNLIAGYNQLLVQMVKVYRELDEANNELRASLSGAVQLEE
ncbi:hypothetical protein KQI65_02405 [bacterium]|nr:hypothetical protein [bacterium]